MALPATPSIVLILADNLGWGELGCYGGGILRGAPTPRLDALAAEGLKLLNFNVESDCNPTRSALMTGRHPIRTGAVQSVPAGLPQGLHPWEITLAQLLSAQGYATACYGKWHLGDRAGRFPTDRGFDEWYGIPRTSNESMFTTSAGYDPEAAPLPYVMESRKGEAPRNVDLYDLEMRDAVDALGIGGETLFIFASDNGPEFRRPWRGTAGPWTGTYHTSMEGGLRVPFIARWPGQVPAGKVSNEIVHVTDLYTTLARIAGAAIPADRPVDGVDQLDFLSGNQERSSREGFLFYIKTELRAVKWRNWKMHLVWEPEPNAGANHLEAPYIFNIVEDPKEETDVALRDNWVRTPMRRMIYDFEQSLKAHPPIPPGAPDDYV